MGRRVIRVLGANIIHFYFLERKMIKNLKESHKIDEGYMSTLNYV